MTKCHQISSNIVRLNTSSSQVCYKNSKYFEILECNSIMTLEGQDQISSNDRDNDVFDMLFLDNLWAHLINVHMSK